MTFPRFWRMREPDARLSPGDRLGLTGVRWQTDDRSDRTGMTRASRKRRGRESRPQRSGQLATFAVKAWTRAGPGARRRRHFWGNVEDRYRSVVGWVGDESTTNLLPCCWSKIGVQGSLLCYSKTIFINSFELVVFITTEATISLHLVY